MRRILSLTLALGGILGVAALLFASRSSTPALALTNCDVTHGAMDSLELEMLGLINVERARVGAAPLLPSQALARAATWMSQDIIDNNYFSHTDSLGRAFNKRLSDCGNTGGYIGENLAIGSSDPAAIVDGWMNSPGHRAAMLSTNFIYAGIGHYESAWTLDFGSVNGDGTVPTLPGQSPTATNTPTPTRTPTPTATASPSPSLTSVPGRAVVPLVVAE